MRLAGFQFALLLTLLASGCCCLPQLSGRYEQCPPTANASASSAGAACACDKPRDGLLARHHGQHREHGRRHWPWGHPDEPGTPPGELVPLPRFHPVPVRPVFEPQYDYSQAQFLGPTPPQYGHLPQGSSGEPTPAKPIPDAE